MIIVREAGALAAMIVAFFALLDYAIPGLQKLPPIAEWGRWVRVAVFGVCSALSYISAVGLGRITNYVIFGIPLGTHPAPPLQLGTAWHAVIATTFLDFVDLAAMGLIGCIAIFSAAVAARTFKILGEDLLP